MLARATNALNGEHDLAMRYALQAYPARVLQAHTLRRRPPVAAEQTR
jgi:hypothetical protein